MTEFELVTAASDFMSKMDLVFEFWMTGTFAALISYFFIGEKASNFIIRMGGWLYFVFSLTMIFRYMNYGTVYQSIRQQLIDMNSIAVTSDSSVSIAALLYFILFTIGTVTTIYFIFRRSKIIGKT